MSLGRAQSDNSMTIHSRFVSSLSQGGDTPLESTLKGVFFQKLTSQREPVGPYDYVCQFTAQSQELSTTRTTLWPVVVGSTKKRVLNTVPYSQ